MELEIGLPARDAHSSRLRERKREREDARRKSLLLSSLESNLSEMVVERKERYREKLSRSVFDERHLERTLCCEIVLLQKKNEG